MSTTEERLALRAGDWRHARTCSFEKGNPDCDCGLDDALTTLHDSRNWRRLMDENDPLLARAIGQAMDANHGADDCENFVNHSADVRQALLNNTKDTIEEGQ